MTKRLIAVGYALSVLGVFLFGSYVIGVSHATQACLVKYGNIDNQSTAELREASRDKDDADWDVKRLAIHDHVPLSDPRVQAAWDNYDKAIARLNAVRDANPQPPFRCGD